MKKRIRIGDLVKLTDDRLNKFPYSNYNEYSEVMLVTKKWIVEMGVTKGFLLLNLRTGIIQGWYTKHIEKI